MCRVVKIFKQQKVSDCVVQCGILNSDRAHILYTASPENPYFVGELLLP